MVYTSGLWEGARTLDEAQEAKLDFVCRKLALHPGMKVLDIGCGWGSFAKFAAERYGVEVLGVTLSHRQAELGQKMCAGLPVELRLQDYRDVRGSFDRVVSLGMFEHVGPKNYRKFFRATRNVLHDSGRFFLSTIGSRRTVIATDAWFDRYIFPNYHLPSLSQIGGAVEGHFLVEELQDWAAHYDATLMAWFHNFEANWPKLRGQYGERFYRRWKLYLLLSAGEFRSRRLQMWEILMSPICVAKGSTASVPVYDNSTFQAKS
jgi:cyclopropane-fatty-acyl-phospholipid synthase